MNSAQNEWAVLSQQVAEFTGLPDWVPSICEKPFHEITEANEVRSDAKVLDESYIAFLSEQIELNARGEDWTALLRKRQEALSPWVGKETLVLSISSQASCLRIWYDPKRLQ